MATVVQALKVVIHALEHSISQVLWVLVVVVLVVLVNVVWAMWVDWR
jgi:hypothetical protein